MSDISPERIQAGFEQFARMLGTERATEMRAAWHRISPEFEKFVLGSLAAEMWTRPQLDLRTRSLVTVGGLSALGRSKALALNIEMALTNGATREEICEAILQMGFYAGFPTAWEGIAAATEVFERLDG